MSFNPLTQKLPEVVLEQPDGVGKDIVDILGEEDVPNGRKILQVVIAVIQCLFAAGIIFGYAALKPVLIAEGVYRERCTKAELKDEVSVCYGQETRLNLMFTLAAVATNISALPIGYILDKYGPRACAVIGSLLIFLGGILFAFAQRFPAALDGFIPGYFFLALGGPFVHISSFHLSNCFPANSSLILALFTGGFDSSSALFFLFRLVYKASDGKINIERFFLIYLVVPVFIFVAQVTVMPALSYKTINENLRVAEEGINKATAEVESNASRDAAERERIRSELRFRRESVITVMEAVEAEREENEDKKNDISGIWGALHGYSAMEQIKTGWFWLATAFAMVQMLRINYFVATIRPQYRYFLHSNKKAETVNSIFDIALPLGGLLSVPFVGTFLDNTGSLFALTVLVLSATVIGILGCVPTMWAAIANVVLFVIYRPFFYTTVSDYAAKVFGFVTFGKVYGLIICVAGVFNLLESPLDEARYMRFDGDPAPINAVLLVVAFLAGTGLLVYVYVGAKRLKREKIEESNGEGAEAGEESPLFSSTVDYETRS